MAINSIESKISEIAEGPLLPVNFQNVPKSRVKENGPFLFME